MSNIGSPAAKPNRTSVGSLGCHQVSCGTF